MTRLERSAPRATGGAPGWHLGIDVGGTFCDGIAVGPGQASHVVKLPHHGGDPAAAMLMAYDHLLAAAGIDSSAVSSLIHGSTVATNLLLERRSAAPALLVSQGLGGVMTLGRQNRRALHARQVSPQTPVDLLPEALRFEIAGRLDARGRKVESVDPNQVRQIARRLADEGVATAAIGLLFSHLDSTQEETVARLLQEANPELQVSLSSRVNPQAGEYERWLMAVLDAYIKPGVQQYLLRLQQGLEARGAPVLRVLASDGSALSLTAALDQPLALAMSGPGAAVRGVLRMLDAGLAERPLITLDIGGTTSDLCFLHKGEPAQTDTLTLADLTLRLPSAAIRSVAIGGGSRVRVLDNGSLTVGPDSAGADPGPACFGRGGIAATITDCLSVLGQMPDHLAAGLMVDHAAAREALRELAQPLGISIEAVAREALRVARHRLAEAVRDVAVDAGFDPRHAVLVPAGGGGGLHAAEVARLVGITRLAVPARPGIATACGLLDEAAGSLALQSELVGSRGTGLGPALLTARDTTLSVPEDWRWERGPGGMVLLEAERMKPGSAQPFVSSASEGSVASEGSADSAAFVGSAGSSTPAGSADATASRRAVNSVSLDILDLRLTGIANRMQRRMVQSAVSAVARDAEDCAAAVFLPDGRLLAQARSLPLLLGSLIPAVAGILRRYPAADMQPGDVFLLNDPWHGGTHLPDWTLLTPVHVAGRVAALAVTILHHQDVGGGTPGSLPPDASDIFQEGLRLPPVYWRRRGQLMADVHAILMLNSRTSEHLEGDLNAQWLALQSAGAEVHDLIVELGAHEFAAQAEALIARGAQQTRAALAALDDGDFSWTDQLDPRPEHDAIRLTATLRKRADTLTIDFSGSSEQQTYPLNATPAAMLAAAFYFMRCLAPSAANNHGCLEPLHLHLPEGTVVNPLPPAPVNARTATVKLACNTLLAAWAQANPERAAAPNASVAVVMAVGGQRADGSHYQFTEIIAGGAGAGPDGPGASGTSTDVGNARNLPAEVLEAIAPVRVEHIGLHAGSGGEGCHRGGDGATRIYRLLEGSAVVTYRGERHHSQAAGAAGGLSGKSSRAWLERADGRREEIASKARFEWYANDRLCLQTAGGGGWGQPR